MVRTHSLSPQHSHYTQEETVAKKKDPNDKPAKTRSRFTDPVPDAMRKIGNGFKALEDLDNEDKITVLRWVKTRFVDQLEEITT